MKNTNTTPFSIIYDSFFNKITEDMYMELNEVDTHRLLEQLLKAAIQKFEFPRFNINDYCETEINRVDTYQGEESNDEEAVSIVYDNGYFNCALTQEEINILSTYMVVEWIGQQLASIENIRMKYSGSDFKFTSQANHIAKLTALKKEYEREGFHLQRLYKRRRMDDNGIMRSTFGDIMSESPEGRNLFYENNR